MMAIALVFWVYWLANVAVLTAFDVMFMDKPDIMRNVLAGAGIAAASTALGAMLC